MLFVGYSKAERNVAVGVGGVMPSKSIGRCLMPFDQVS